MGISNWRRGSPLRANRRLQVLLVVLAVLVGLVVVVCASYFWPGGQDDLTDQLRSSDRSARLAAIDALARDGSDEAMQAVAEVAGDEDVRVASRAVLAVSNSRLRDRRKYVMAAAQDPRAEVREAGMIGVGRLGDKQEAAMLSRVVDDRAEDEHVRAAAVQAIGQMRAWRHRDAAIRALEDPSARVRGRAGAAVRSMIGRDFKFRANDPPDKRKAAVGRIRHFLSQQ